MKRSNLLDFLIVLLVYLALSAFPFSRFIANGTVVIILQIVAQCFISTFMSFFLAKRSKLNHTLYKLNVKNTILLLPTVLVCFSNLLFMLIMNKGINISFGLGSILPIILTMILKFQSLLQSLQDLKAKL